MMAIILMSHAPVHYLDPDYVEQPIVLTILYIIVWCVLLRYNNSEVSSELLNEELRELSMMERTRPVRAKQVYEGSIKD